MVAKGEATQEARQGQGSARRLPATPCGLGNSSVPNLAPAATADKG